MQGFQIGLSHHSPAYPLSVRWVSVNGDHCTIVPYPGDEGNEATDYRAFHLRV